MCFSESSNKLLTSELQIVILHNSETEWRKSTSPEESILFIIIAIIK